MPTANRSSSEVTTRRPSPLQAGNGVNTLAPLVEWLTQFGTSEHWVVSCYLKLEPRDRTRGKYLIKLKNRIRDRQEWLANLGLERGEREVVERDIRRIREYLEHPDNVLHGQGIAIFASEPLDLFEAVPLPRVFRSRLAVDRTPLVRELAALDDEFGLVVCVVYDRTSARFFRVSAFGVAELPGLAAADSTRAGKFHGPRSQWGVAGTTGSPGEHNYHQRIREEKQRHYAHIAQRLFELSRTDGVRGVVLAGNGADADAVRPHLHPYLEKQILGTTRLNPKAATPAEVMDAVLAVRRDSERQWEREHIRALTDGLGTGWAVNGIEAALGALGCGQVRVLLVDPAVETPGFRCTDSGRLTTDADGCGNGAAMALADVVDEAIEDALRQGGHVDVLEDEEARRPIDGLAALLRFKQ